MTRSEFLALSWDEQKKVDFRTLFDPETTTALVANCINHQDDTASMHIYENAVWCYGCRKRWWPDQFLKDLGQRQLQTERGARKQPAPKYIPFAVADTYRRWLSGLCDGPYNSRLRWLLDRGLTPETCNINYIGHSGEAFTIPVLQDDKVVSIRFRRDDELASEDRPKYWGTAGANQAMLYVPKRPLSVIPDHDFGLLLCEGELDALRLVQEGYPAASLTNGCNALKEEHLANLKWISPHSKRISIVYDQDSPGRAASSGVWKMLGQAGFIVRNIWWNPKSGKDVTEWLQKPNGAEFFAEYLRRVWESN